MKKITTPIIQFIKLNSALLLLPIIIVFVIRIMEYLTLPIDSSSLNSTLFRSFTYSLEFDLIFLAIFYLLTFIPFLLLYLISKRLFSSVYNFFLVIITFSTLFLTQFFYASGFLLDKTIFFFGFKELQIIVSGESKGVVSEYFWLYLLTVLTLIILMVWGYRKVLKVKKLRIAGQVLTVTALCLFILRGEVHPKYSHKRTFYETQVHSSKVSFFYGSIFEDIFSNNLNYENYIEEAHKFRKLYNKTGSLKQLMFPLLRDVDDFSTVNWNEYLSLDKEPNIVFIFSEGLSSSFVGEDAHFGSMTPFLDSLIGKSLYWPNMLSITDRTHGVFSAALASLPHGFERGFLNYKDGVLSNYTSIPRLLKKKNYALNFFYGGWSGFDNYRKFLKTNKFDHFIDKYYIDTVLNFNNITTDEFSWGYNDQITVKSYFKFLNQQVNIQPYFNVYLTLSLHSPFQIPNLEYYFQEAKRKLNQVDPKLFKTHKKEVSVVYYSDQSLKEFFSNYKKRSDFNNTVFFIMGDHNVHNLGLKSDIDVYHVPFIIYSPKIKKPEKFNEIISHWDVPATLIDLLPNMQLKANGNVSHWLGNGVTFSKKTKSNSPIFLGSFSGNLYGVVIENYVYIHNKLYLIEKGLNLTPSNNHEKAQKMKAALENYKWINNYVMTKDRIMPKKSLDTIQY